jgi:hypothetical protein
MGLLCTPTKEDCAMHIGRKVAWVVVVCLGWAGGLPAQQIHQQGFEGRDTLWVQGPSQATFQEVEHRLTDARKVDQPDERVNSGQRAEFIHLDVKQGKFIHYLYKLGKAPVSEDLRVSLWLCSNHPGVQFYCRVVLPHEEDPRNPGQKLTLLLPGEPYQAINRWQKVGMSQPVRLLRDQVRLLRASRNKDVVSEDAYVDSVVLNLCPGPGDIKVWIDDLEAGPVDAEVKPPQEVISRPMSRAASTVSLEGGHLKVGNDRFFLMGIRHTGTPLKVLRQAGFNTVWLDESTPDGLIEDAASLGFWIVPTIGRREELVRGQLAARGTEVARKASRFLDSGAVLSWDVGANLTQEDAVGISRSARLFHSLDNGRPIAADISDGYGTYAAGPEASNLLVGAHRWPLLTGLELQQYRDWLLQRRRLVPRETFCWTWIQTHLPDWFTTVAYNRGSNTRFEEPVGPQPEQIRLLSYIALGCGYRGLGYWSDRFLADSHSGRDRLLSLALLNLEMRMLEPLLLEVKDSPEWIDTSNPEVKAAVLRSEKAILVLPIWMGKGGQFAPGHASTVRLNIVVPQVPATHQCWEVLPGMLRSYPTRRVLGGTQVTLDQFSLTTALVFTSDFAGQIVRFQVYERRSRLVAAQWAHDLAEEELAKALRVQEELDRLGQKLPDAEGLVEKARQWLDRCQEHRRNHEFTEAYTAAQVALQTVRLLVRAHWEQAVRGLASPVASPYAVSFYTLPRHYKFVDEVRRLKTERNLLPEGSFETPPQERMPTWTPQEEVALDDVLASAERSAEFPQEGKQCLKLTVAAKPGKLPPTVLERTFVAIHTPSVRLTPGTIVKITGWVRVPARITGSVDGVLFYDSAGGEPLAVRITEPVPLWKQYTLYRIVPADGHIYVTMALTGLGSAYFDDIRIEPLTPKDAPGAPPPARPGTLVSRPSQP